MAEAGPKFAFDGDGVLFDSHPMQADVEIQAAREMGVDTDIHDWKDFKGMARVAIWEAVGTELHTPQDYVDRVVATTVALVQERGFDIIPEVPGAINAVNTIHDENGPSGLALVTSTRRPIVDTVLDLYGWKDTFGAVIAYTESGMGDKPKPGPYLAAAQRLRVQPSGMYVVEDSKSGVTAGVAAGSPTIGLDVEQGVGTREQLEEAGAHHIAESHEEVRDIVDAA